MSDRIVISGVGLVTCLGLSAEASWRGIIAGRRALGPMGALESRPKQDKGGGQAPDLPAEFAPGLPREVRYLRSALREAMDQARWSERGDRRVACVVGTTLHGMRQGGEYLRSGRLEPLCSFLATHTLSAALRGAGVNTLAATTCSACSSGLGSVALGATLLDSGEADVVICGGYDPVSEYAYAGFDSLRLIDEGAIRPFGRGRQGMKVAEGYAIVVIERERSVRARGAEVLAEVAGFGESADAHHLTQPHPEGEGAARAIEAALASAEVERGEIGLIAAHATATPNNDAAEHAALARVFGQGLARTPAVAFKSHLGHTLGAAGAAELILALGAMRAGLAPPTAGTTRDDAEFADLGLRFGEATPARIGATLNTSLGFGGANTCVVLSHRERARPERARASRRVLITGVGVVLPGAIGNDAFVSRLESGPATPAITGRIDESAIGHLINARRMRRMSDYSKLTLAATAAACADAGIADVPAFASSCSAILGSAHGSAAFCEEYYGQIVKGGIEAANPVLFAEGVPNAAAAQLSLMLGVKGGCQTIIGSRTSGLDALRLAALRIASGLWERALVSAGEEWTTVLGLAYGQRGLCARPGPDGAAAGLPYSDDRGFVLGSGAVTIVLESEGSAGARGVRARAAVGAGAWGWAESLGEVPAATARAAGPLRDAQVVIGSGNGTWIDGAESAGLARSAEGARVTSMAGYFAEAFSVGPLAAVAAAALTGGAPALAGDGRVLRGAGAWRGGVAKRVGVLATDYAGGSTGVVIDTGSAGRD